MQVGQVLSPVSPTVRPKISRTFCANIIKYTLETSVDWKM
jgi:hypothetical protein